MDNRKESDIFAKNCRICGLKQDEAPWSGERKNIPSYGICSCCGVEFGLEDDGLYAVVQYRRNWLMNGLQWFDSSMRPADWDIDCQFSCIPPEYGFSPLINNEESFYRLFDAKEFRLLKRARIETKVWLSVLASDFEKFSLLAAESTSLIPSEINVLLKSRNKKVYERLIKRSHLTPNDLQRIEEFLAKKP